MIAGNLVDVRPVTVSDISVLHGWEHTIDIASGLATEATMLDARERAETEYERLLRTPRVRLLAVQSKDGVVVGFLRLHDLDFVARHANVRIFIATEFQARGFGTDALRTVLRFCFDELGLHRVGLVVRADNSRALHVYHALGFTDEGRERDVVWSGGKWIDFVHMGILEEEWARSACERTR